MGRKPDLFRVGIYSRTNLQSVSFGYYKELPRFHEVITRDRVKEIVKIFLSRDGWEKGEDEDGYLVLYNEHIIDGLSWGYDCITFVKTDRLNKKLREIKELLRTIEKKTIKVDIDIKERYDDGPDFWGLKQSLAEPIEKYKLVKFIRDSIDYDFIPDWVVRVLIRDGYIPEDIDEDTLNNILSGAEPLYQEVPPMAQKVEKMLKNFMLYPSMVSCCPVYRYGNPYAYGSVGFMITVDKEKKQILLHHKDASVDLDTRVYLTIRE